MTLHIFNPENDMALADGKAGYTPPATIRQMRRELSGLPYWWAEDGDWVMSADGMARQLNGDGTSTTANTEVGTPLAMLLQPGDVIRPWGWSPALKHQLQLAGVGEDFMPSDEALERLRQLSHRRTAVDALREMRQDFSTLSVCSEFSETSEVFETSENFGTCDILVGHSVLCHSYDEVLTAASGWEKAIMKAPWSSSGKGLMMVGAPNAHRWAERIIRQQGSIVVEEFLDRQADFAMEFWCEGGDVRYEGLSLFYTNDACVYQGNWVAPEGQKMAWLASVAAPRALAYIQQWWMRRLREVDYEGPVGVDMLLTRDGRINPCVEINWRMTMGLVSVWMARRGSYGKLLVEYTYGHYSAEIEPFA